MPQLTTDTLTAWMREFTDQGHRFGGTIRVLSQEVDEPDHDSGLVVVQLEWARVDVYVLRPGSHGTRWITTFGSRQNDISLDAAGVAALANELQVVSALCAFLERKTSALASGVAVEVA